MKKWKSTFRVGIYKCHMTFSPQYGIDCAWEPDLPTNRSLSQQEIEQYRAGRDALLAEAAKELGGSVLVVET